MEKLLIFSIFVSFSAFSSVSKKQGDLLKKVSKEQKKIERDIQNLKRKINNIESKIVRKNNNYLKAMEQRNRIERSIETLRKKVITNSTDLKKFQIEAEDFLKKMVLSGLGGELTSSEQFVRKVLIDQYKNKIKRSRKIREANGQLNDNIKALSKRYVEYKELERDVSGLIESLENQKRIHAHNYLEKVRRKKDLNIKASKLAKTTTFKKVKKSLEKSVLLRFAKPLGKFKSYRIKDKKGLEFQYSGAQPILASQGGKVIYVGDIAPYGKVVMLDHGSQTKSILLGDIIPKIKKGQVVNKGMPIGETPDKITGGKLYFEVRKKSQALNTYHLMSKKFKSLKKI